jgi:hypothetical protein
VRLQKNDRAPETKRSNGLKGDCAMGQPLRNTIFGFLIGMLLIAPAAWAQTIGNPGFLPPGPNSPPAPTNFAAEPQLLRIPRDGERGFHGNVNGDSRGS